MLIDSYPLQQAVLDSDIPAEMLAGLDEIGLDGIAVLGDGLRKPIAVAEPLLGPADYEGITFEAFRSQDHADAIRALGATPTDVRPDAGRSATGRSTGSRRACASTTINEIAYLAPYVTANVNLWPHTLALIANPQTMADLTETQRNWLIEAGSDAASRSTDLTDDDSDLRRRVVPRPAPVSPTPPTADLAAMRQAFAPSTRTSTATRSPSASSSRSRR